MTNHSHLRGIRTKSPTDEVHAHVRPRPWRKSSLIVYLYDSDIIFSPCWPSNMPFDFPCLSEGKSAQTEKRPQLLYHGQLPVPPYPISHMRRLPACYVNAQSVVTHRAAAAIPGNERTKSIRRRCKIGLARVASASSSSAVAVVVLASLSIIVTRTLVTHSRTPSFPSLPFLLPPLLLHAPAPAPAPARTACITRQ